MDNRQIPSRKRQHGIGMVSVFVMLSIGIFLGIFAIKVVPEYLENWTVTKIAQDTVDNPALLNQTKSKIYNHLNKAYRQNNLWDLKAEETIVLEKLGRNRGYSLTVKYEKRTQFLHNISLVTSFEDTPVVGSTQ